MSTENELKLRKYIVEKPNIRLNPGEICYYQGEASSYRDHVITTGRNSFGGGFSFRLSKNVSYHTGGGASENVRTNVPDIYPGVFYMTNQRVIMLSEKLGFDMPWYKLTSIQDNGENALRFFFGSQQYTIIPKQYRKIKKIMQYIDVSDAPQEEVDTRDTKEKHVSTPKQLATGNSMSTADELLKYKKLLDAGALTQEEFDSVKRKLLGSADRPAPSEHSQAISYSEPVETPTSTNGGGKSIFSSAFNGMKDAITSQYAGLNESDSNFKTPEDAALFSSSAEMQTDAWGHKTIGELTLYPNTLIFVSDDQALRKTFRVDMIDNISTIGVGGYLMFIYGGKSISFKVSDKKEWKKQIKAAKKI